MKSTHIQSFVNIRDQRKKKDENWVSLMFNTARNSLVILYRERKRILVGQLFKLWENMFVPPTNLFFTSMIFVIKIQLTLEILAVTKSISLMSKITVIRRLRLIGTINEIDSIR